MNAGEFATLEEAEQRFVAAALGATCHVDADWEWERCGSECREALRCAFESAVERLGAGPWQTWPGPLAWVLDGGRQALYFTADLGAGAPLVAPFAEHTDLVIFNDTTVLLWDLCAVQYRARARGRAFSLPEMPPLDAPTGNVWAREMVRRGLASRGLSIMGGMADGAAMINALVGIDGEAMGWVAMRADEMGMAWVIDAGGRPTCGRHRGRWGAPPGMTALQGLRRAFFAPVVQGVGRAVVAAGV